MSARILIVDDEPINLALLEAVLAPLGHQVIQASNGLAALELYQASPPDLILLDYVMPGLDGLGVLAHIRAQSPASRVPVILITAHSDREHRLRGLDAGADEFLEKPIDTAVLRARVKTLLNLKASHDALLKSTIELEVRRRAVEEARQQHKELTEFIVHDLKTPLSVVCANLDFADHQTTDANTELSGAIRDARFAAQRLTTMVTDLLMISRMEDSTFALHLEGITLTTLLRNVMQSFITRARDRGIALAAPADLGIELKADRSLIMRVLENILDNAFRYTPDKGRISVEARTATDIEISVSNDGPAIPERQRSSIFEKFRRGASEDASRSNAGLGLYFCKRAIEAHGGAIEVVDTAGFPTSFRISLPRS